MSKSFVLRLDPKLFEELRFQAARQQSSINAYCVSLLNKSKTPAVQLESTVEHLRGQFGDDLLAVVLFGSAARGTQTASSDIDLMIVLKDNIAIGKFLYRRWDACLAEHPEAMLANQISPHFVHLVSDISLAGSLWLEVAIEGKILWTCSEVLETKLRELRSLIAEGKFKRSYSYGIPYWKKVA